MRDTLHHNAAWLATPVLAVIVYLGLYGLSAMLEMGSWRFTVATMLLIAAAATAITRFVTASRLWPTLVGAAAVLLASVPLFARSETGETLWLPTLEAFRSLGQSASGAIHYASTTVSPAPMVHELLFLLTITFALLFLAADHIAAGWRAGALAGIVLILPWMPSAILQLRIATPALLLSIVLWLVVLGLTKKWTSGDRAVAPGSVLVSTGVTLGLVLLVAPTALGGNGWGAIPRISTGGDFDVATRLNLDVDLRTSLTTGSDVQVMRYVTEGRQPEVLRLYTLTEFDGTSWVREDPEPTDHKASDGVLWPVPSAVASLEPGSGDRITVQILNLAETNLPVPAVPRVVDVGNAWSYVPEMDEIITEGNGTSNLTYSILAYQSYLSAAELSRQGLPAPLDLDAGVDARYTKIPASMDFPRVYALAQEITADSQSRFDQALAIQTYFRNNRDFEYDTSVTPTGSDSVSAFLDAKRGYCVQYATTMVMMLRTLDVPARLAIGFLPGTAQADGSFVIAGRNAHAWPEVWFPEVGWVRFEPTPARQSGSVPRHADPASDVIPVPPSVLEAAQQGGDYPVPTTLPEPNRGRPGDPDEVLTPVEEGVPVVTIVAAAVGGAGLVILLWWLVRHRRTHSAGTHGIEGWWERLRLSLGEEDAWPLTLTPHEAAEHLRQVWHRRGLPLDAAQEEALVRVVTAVSDARYAPSGSEAEAIAVRADVETLIAWGADETTDRPRRGGARSALPSST